MRCEIEADELDRIAAAVAGGPPPYYPTERLYLEQVTDLGGGRVLVPGGPWCAAVHPNRVAPPPGEVIDPWPAPGPDAAALAEQWLADGGSVDQHGHRLHPHWRQLLADPRVGLPTGPGWHYRLGPSRTAAAVLLRDGGREVLLIQRADNQRWALPAGFLGPQDATVEDGALRELGEETGLWVPDPRTSRLLELVPTGRQATLHAWTELTVIRVEADAGWLAQAVPVRRDAAGEVLDAAWWPVDGLGELTMQHRHPDYIRAGVRDLRGEK